MLLMVVYALISLSPLAPLALKSPVLAHAITGECAGDCDICGCAPERSASHTCCCWMKKMREQRSHAAEAACRLPEEPRPACCSRPRQQPARSCCAVGPVDAEPEKTVTIVYRCAPCGKDKAALAWENESCQHLPYLFTGNLCDALRPAYATHQPDPLKYRHLEPPVPPPKTDLHA